MTAERSPIPELQTAHDKAEEAAATVKLACMAIEEAADTFRFNCQGSDRHDIDEARAFYRGAVNSSDELWTQTIEVAKWISKIATREVAAVVRENIRPIVDGIDLASVLQPSKRHKPPGNLDDHALGTIVTKHPEGDSMYEAGTDGVLPEGWVSNAREDPDGQPYLDTGQAIALGHRNQDGQMEVRAVAAAGVDVNGKRCGRPGALVINQLQTISPGGETGNAGLREAFRGINWRKTLVASWEHAATRLGAKEVVIVSAENNEYPEVSGAPLTEEDRKQYGSDEEFEAHRDGHPPLHSAYDDVARSMGYQQDEQTRNWVKSLP